MKNKKLYLVAGGTGELGRSYIETLPDSVDIISFSRKTPFMNPRPNQKHMFCNLTSPREVQTMLKNISFKNYKEVYFIHSIGIDKFEMQSYPNIQPLTTLDSDVYDSNVNTYKYMEEYLIKTLLPYAPKIKLILSMIGSVADKHNVIFLSSFTESKNIVRGYMRHAQLNHSKWISCVVLNISSMITKSALKTRPYADTTYFLSPDEVSKRLYNLTSTFKKGYKEQDIYKENPHFENDYYQNTEKIYKKWKSYVYGVEIH